MGRKMKKFTLIELLIIIAIIGILCTLLIPSLRKARDEAITAVCLSNQKQIATAEYSYISANNGSFTPSSLASPYNHVSYDDLLSSYLGVDLTIAQQKNTLGKNNILAKKLESFFLCPNDDIKIVSKFSSHARRSYALNAAGGFKGLGYNGWSIKYTKVTNPAETIMFVEQHHEFNVLTRGNHSYAKSLEKWLLTQEISPHGFLKFTWAIVDGSAKVMNPYKTGGLKNNWGMWKAVTD
jgi:Tfp pilus assembly protein PilE